MLHNRHTDNPSALHVRRCQCRITIDALPEVTIDSAAAIDGSIDGSLAVSVSVSLPVAVGDEKRLGKLGLQQVKFGQRISRHRRRRLRRRGDKLEKLLAAAGVQDFARPHERQATR